MATKDTVVQELVVNTLTQAQFDAAKESGTLNPYELYGTPDTTAETLNGKADTDLGNIPANYDYVVESQEPTAGNGYTWYRKYKSGWVEQGGCLLNATTGVHTITIPIEMASVEELKKSVIVTPIYISGVVSSQGVSVRNSNDSSWSTTQIDCFSWGDIIHIKWQVSGMAS